MRGGASLDVLCHGIRFERIISIDNLLYAWREFVKGKRSKADIQVFGLHLMDNLLDLRHDLSSRTYQHGGYKHFKISDPKPRDIHKASVRDRLVHHSVHRVLYPYFDRKFISDSYSCRLGKGTHRAMNRFRTFAFNASQNHTRTCWVLKCDIKKFFASIDHAILKEILAKHIKDQNTLWLLDNLIDSFVTTDSVLIYQDISPKGLPLGNLTSQLLVNIYMNEFDQFIKHTLKIKYYVRYADDFVILSPAKQQLENYMPLIKNFLETSLKLTLHPTKCFTKTFASGVDFLGWVHFPDHRVLRTSTKRRMLRHSAIGTPTSWARLGSYAGMLSHGNGYKLGKKVL